MKLPGYYSSGEFAKMAHITKKTIRYYDEHNILKPSYVNENGARFYTDGDFARLQQILLLKYLGFSLDDIKEMTISDDDHFLSNSLKMQLKLIEDRIDQLQLVKEVLGETAARVDGGEEIDWSRLLQRINLTGMEKSLRNQYQNASNISSRISLHSQYSQNPLGWFPWIYEQCRIGPGLRVLEVGCGDGSLWTRNADKVPRQLSVTLSDISAGMVRDARRAVGQEDSRYTFRVMDCQKLPEPEGSYDRVIANHVLFYCQDISRAAREISRVLKTGGLFICSAYGRAHMQEIGQLAAEFDDRIVLSADKLYDKFGKENGAQILKPYFSSVEWIPYEDSLNVTEADPLISYILSCHGNQNQYIVDRYNDFRNFVRKRTAGGFHVTKDAGIFLLRK